MQQTINQVFTQHDLKPLGNWALWMNDTQLRLAKLTIRRRTQIPVKYHTTEHYSDGQFKDGSFWWECGHASTGFDTDEQVDEYQEAVTGIHQPVYQRQFEYCDDCNATRDLPEGDWEL